jgi:dihydroxyacetone kinase-like protein
VLFIVKNYTGDVMNFEAAAELVHAEGINIQSIVIDDDVAVKESLYTAGRRGVGTTVMAEKILGAAADAGYDLDQCAVLGRKVNQYGRSMGMALTSCTVPAAGKPTFELGEKEVEMGIGIHGEPGTHRMGIKPVDELVTYMAETIINDPAYTRTLREWDRESGLWVEKEFTDDPFVEGEEMIAFVNSMGGTPISELYVAYRKLVEVCKAMGISIVRNLVGHYITALEMQGLSITLLKTDKEILTFWDAPVKTPALHMG